MAVIDMEKLVTSTVMPANTTEEIPWVETTIAGGFRIWQVLFLSGAVLLAVVIILCCCVRIRIPRTKQEIEADFRRKQLSKRFKQELKRIRNSELDVMDLRRALDRVRADFHSDTESFCGNQSDIFTSLAQGGVGSPGEDSPVDSSDYNVTQQWLEMQMSKLRTSAPLPKPYTTQRV
ncbi:uncharacterized protein LOC124207265 [Daphnia pulex]|uniref:uncharacterized protein LOC124207265 n=1 Tax=Daphnia pulex TaxID=6669 RepID=UPI001EDCDEBA|nr:uncharacterized protein LOC124207265 [Daphnia pulex]XP_046634528.1 uncharacterized protein LOC124313761 [Daphnia pulicaria]